MPTLPTHEQWKDTVLQMVSFHQEQGLVWLWLPTPMDWVEQLRAHETNEQRALRNTLIAPSTVQPVGLVWYAWDTRSSVDNAWMKDEQLLRLWYSHWMKAHASVVK